MAGLQERGTVQKQGLGHSAVRCDPAPDRNTWRDEGGVAFKNVPNRKTEKANYKILNGRK